MIMYDQKLMEKAFAAINNKRADDGGMMMGGGSDAMGGGGDATGIGDPNLAGNGEAGATSLADAGGTSLSGPSPIAAMGGPMGTSGPPSPGPLATSMPLGGPSPLAINPMMNQSVGSPMTPAGDAGFGLGKMSSASQFGKAAGIAAARAAAKKR